MLSGIDMTLHDVMRERADCCRMLVLWVCIYMLGLGAQAWGASKRLFPDIHSHHMLHRLHDHVTEDINFIYMYSALALLDQKPHKGELHISTYEYTNIMPLLTLDVYHKIDVYFQTEIFDYTIWGVMENYLFHDIKTVAHEYQRDQSINELRDIRKSYHQNINMLDGIYYHEVQKHSNPQNNITYRNRTVERKIYDLVHDDVYDLKHIEDIQRKNKKFGITKVISERDNDREDERIYGKQKEGIVAKYISQISTAFFSLYEKKILACFLFIVSIFIRVVPQ